MAPQRKHLLTLIIAVYNAPRYLEFVFEGLRRQTYSDFEAIIADDGSGAEMKAFLDRSIPDLPFPARHVWQPDAGFRKNMILNKAVEAASTDYLVFIDGDCIPHRAFLRDHWENHLAGSVLSGRRVNFGREITERLSLADIRSGRHEHLSLRVLWDGLMARSSNLEDAVRIPSPGIRRMLHRNRAGILGCNFSVERKLLEHINGFNEEYQAPGIGEDTDIAYRLVLAGARLVTMRYLAILYHLYHPQTMAAPDNQRLFDQLLKSNEPVCRRGIRDLTGMAESKNA